MIRLRWVLVALALASPAFADTTIVPDPDPHSGRRTHNRRGRHLLAWNPRTPSLVSRA